LALRTELSIDEFHRRCVKGFGPTPSADELLRIEDAVRNGATLTMVESSFDDPGDDYCAVELKKDGDTERVWYCPGY
jgi:hypothetical protein